MNDHIDPQDMGCELYVRPHNIHSDEHWKLVGPFDNTAEAIAAGKRAQSANPRLEFRVKNDDHEETHFEDALDFGDEDED